MQRLGGSDANFLYLETPSVHMHIGFTAMFERPPDEERRAGDTGDLRLQETGHRSDQLSRGRNWRHDVGNGCPDRLDEHEDRLRVRQDRDHSRGVFELVPAANSRDSPSVGLDVQRGDHHCGGGAAGWPRPRGGAGRSTSRQRHDVGPPMDCGAFSGSRRDDPADDVSQLGSVASTCGASGRVVVDVLHEHRRRTRRRQRISREA